MSCPYLERGRVALCLAVGRRGMMLNLEGMETDCFSGDFSRCALLLFPPGHERSTRRSTLPLRRSMKRGGEPNGSRKYLPGV
jgi:hypothetical protein